MLNKKFKETSHLPVKVLYGCTVNNFGIFLMESLFTLDSITTLHLYANQILEMQFPILLMKFPIPHHVSYSFSFAGFALA